MKIISHRGLLEGPDHSIENNPSQIDSAIGYNFEVEIDLWKIDDQFYLGHDEPMLEISLNWLEIRSDKLWIHCKNIEALDFLAKNNLNFNYFSHDSDHVVLTSKKNLWVFPGKEYTENSILVALSKKCISSIVNSDIYPLGICTDFPFELKKAFKIL